MKHNILLQGITHDNHCAAVERVLAVKDLVRATISVAYMRASGLALIGGGLEKVAEKTTLIAGVRNGVTTAQAFELALELGCRLYAFDTGSRSIVYHPKTYVSTNNQISRVLIGSANLTYGGLIENVEASVELELQHSKKPQKRLASKLQDELDNLATSYPDHVTRVADKQKIGQLFDSGMLLDESTAVVSTPLAGTNDRATTDVTRIRLHVNRPIRSKPKPFRGGSRDTVSTVGIAPASITRGISARWNLVWESKPLTRRALTIPRGKNTNPTGSMLLGKGQLDGVDHRSHFRDSIFAELKWKQDARPNFSHIERTSADFQLILCNIDCGTYRLKLSHDTRTDSRSYLQRNSMTSLHWGAARRHIAREQLLDSILSLYKNADNPRRFLIEVDG